MADTVSRGLGLWVAASIPAAFIVAALLGAGKRRDQRERRAYTGAREPLDRVVALHTPRMIRTPGAGPIEGCACCLVAWPCQTVRALEPEGAA